MTATRRMSPRRLIAHAAKHENEYVREYIDALIDERRELHAKLTKVSPVGYTEAARATVHRAAWAFFVFLMVAGAYFLGQAGR
ncbi:MAG: hypothetical protein V4550_04975 [Gemmatimonadota bacterium]